MHNRKVGQTGLTLAEIISYIVLSTLIILYICMFVSISLYVQHARQKLQIEKSLLVPDKSLNWIKNGWIGMEKNEIEEKPSTALNEVEQNSKFTVAMTNIENSQVSELEENKATVNKFKQFDNATTTPTLLKSVLQAMRYEYKRVPLADCPDTDIKRLYGDFKACSNECDLIDRCVGFVFGFHKEVEKTYCWLKKHKCNIVPSEADLYLKPRVKTQQVISTEAGSTAQQTHPEAHSTGDKGQKNKQKKGFVVKFLSEDDYDYYDDDYYDNK